MRSSSGGAGFGAPPAVLSFSRAITTGLVLLTTASETGYCDCVCGCYELASLRDDDTGKGYCPACAKDHLDWNAGVGVRARIRQAACVSPGGEKREGAGPSPFFLHTPYKQLEVKTQPELQHARVVRISRRRGR